jgi:hypothetical protein
MLLNEYDFFVVIIQNISTFLQFVTLSMKILIELQIFLFHFLKNRKLIVGPHLDSMMSSLFYVSIMASV